MKKFLIVLVHLFIGIAILLFYRGSNDNLRIKCLYNESSEVSKAVAYLGGENITPHVQGELLIDGELFDFSETLTSIWVRNDSTALGKMLSKSTKKMYEEAGKLEEFNNWGKLMIDHLVYGDRSQPKVFATIINDLSKSPAFQGQKQWFQFPEEPKVAILLYSYHFEKKQMMGRMLYPVSEGSKVKLLLEMPKEMDKN